MALIKHSAHKSQMKFRLTYDRLLLTTIENRRVVDHGSQPGVECVP